MKKIAVLGYGTVGSGVVDLFEINADSIAKNAGEAIEVKYIVDIRDFENDPYQDKLVKDFSIVENDPEVETVRSHAVNEQPRIRADVPRLTRNGVVYLGRVYTLDLSDILRIVK